MTDFNNLIKTAFEADTTRKGPPNINKYERCGNETIALINSLNPQLVLDLGCGNNRYKPHIKNLVGIDIVHKDADIISDISKLDYTNDSVDACLCYGSINFGTHQVIEKQLTEMFRVLKTGGLAVFRGNMNDSQNDAIYYGWNEEKINYWTEFFKVSLYVKPDVIYRTTRTGAVNEKWHDRIADKIKMNHRSIARLYWIWKK